MHIDTLRSSDLAALEAIYADGKSTAIPRGTFRGHYLRPCASAGARRVSNRLMVASGFRLAPFGVDFDQSCWWFGSPRARIGRFAPALGPSRWRSATVVQLHYYPSQLPAWVRRHLYDEVVPLAPELCLGLGGLNRSAGEGELFFFALERV